MQKKCDRVEKVIQVLTQSPEVEKKQHWTDVMLMVNI